MIFNEDELLLPDNSPLETVQITQVLLYYSDEEAKEFKQLGKAGMMRENPTGYKDDNLQDFLLNLLRKLYGNNRTSSVAPTTNG